MVEVEGIMPQPGYERFSPSYLLNDIAIGKVKKKEYVNNTDENLALLNILLVHLCVCFSCLLTLASCKLNILSFTAK